MKTIKLTLLFTIISLTSFAQVGIGNTDPKAALDITASSTISPSNNDGILIPRIDNFPTTNPASDQDGMMVFVTGNGTPAKGFYYWDNGSSSWVSVIGNKNTLDQAYNEGGAGSGKNIDATNGAVRINGTDGFLVTGTFGSGDVIDSEVTGEGTRMFFNPNKAAFRAGYAEEARWDDAYIGIYSFAGGRRNQASGEASTVFGRDNEAGGGYSFAMGLNTGTTSAYSWSAGLNSYTYINSEYSFAFGNSAETRAAYSFAFGQTVDTYGEHSMAKGHQVTAKSYGETVFGLYNTDYTANSTNTFDATDRLFVLGNGIDFSNRSNALTIYKNGRMNINEEYNMPLADGTSGQVMTTDGSGNITFQNIIGDGTGNDWSLTGNTGTNSASEFIGTTDNEALSFRTNNTEKLRLSEKGQLEIFNTGSSVFIGSNAGNNDDLSNNRNVFIGELSGQGNTTGSNNTFLGYRSGASNQTGLGNVAIGEAALFSNNSGQNNIAIGTQSNFNGSGSRNISLGFDSGTNLGTGSNNIIIGDQAGNRDNLTSSQNIYIGAFAGGGTVNNGSAPFYQKTGNIFIGYNAGRYQTASNRLFIENSDSNTPLLYGEFDNDILRINGEFQVGNPTTTGYVLPNTDGTAGQFMTTDGAGNVTFQDFIGDGTGNDWSLNGNTGTNASSEFIGTTDNVALSFRTNNTEKIRLTEKGQLEIFNTGESIFIGENAGENDDLSDNQNVAIGHYALATNTTSNKNVAIGFRALELSTTDSNTALGWNALALSTTGEQNTALGYGTLRSNTLGDYNTASGYLALSSNINGNNNTANGRTALNSNTSGNNNSAYGLLSSSENTVGNENTTMGYVSLLKNINGDNNTTIGSRAGYALNGNNNTQLGFRAGDSDETGDENVYLGAFSGAGVFEDITNTGGENKSGNIFIGYRSGYNEINSDRLYIENSDSNTPLIYGEFDNNILRTNGTFQINDPNITGYVFPITDGSVNQVLTTDGAGNLTFQTPTFTDTDNQQIDDFNFNATTNILTLEVEDDGQAAQTVNLSSLNNSGTDNQQIDTFNFNSSTNVLTLEVEDDGQAAQTVDLTSLNPQKAAAHITLSTDQSNSGGGTTKVLFDTEGFDIGNNFDVSTDEFTAPADGVYRVNAQIAINSSTSTGTFDIRIRVDGSQVRIASFNHSGNGNIIRQISSLVELTAGQTIDIAYQRSTGVTINSNSSISYFDIEQL